MNDFELLSFSAVARLLSISRATVADLTKSLGITPKAMSNGRAKGLDSADIRRLRKLLGLGKPAKAG